MGSGNNFLLVENCLKCEHRDDGVFCHLPDGALDRMRSIKNATVYPKGSLLSSEGQPAKGVFILCSGRARVSTVSSEGETVVLKIAEPGEVLGASAVLGGTQWDTTVEALEQLQANFIPEADFIELLKQYPEVTANTVQQLTHDRTCALEQIAAPPLTPEKKIAKLLLQWSSHPLYVLKKTRREIPMKITARREEIARFAGITRKEVDDILRDFQKKQWLRIKGTTWSILNKPELERLAAS